MQYQSNQIILNQNKLLHILIRIKQERHLRNCGLELPYFLIEDDVSASMCTKVQPRVGPKSNNFELKRLDVIDSQVCTYVR